MLTSYLKFNFCIINLQTNIKLKYLLFKKYLLNKEIKIFIPIVLFFQSKSFIPYINIVNMSKHEN